MVAGMDAAISAARRTLESTYDGRADVTEHRKVKNEKTKITGYEDVTVLRGQPCRLSFSSVAAVSQSESAAKTAQTVKLFLSPDVVIKPNSKITVTQNGTTGSYTNSSIPAVYATHQEIILEIFERWA